MTSSKTQSKTQSKTTKSTTKPTDNIPKNASKRYEALPAYFKNMSDYVVPGYETHLCGNIAMIIRDKMPAKCVDLPKNTIYALALSNIVLVLSRHTKDSPYIVVRVVKDRRFLRTRLLKIEGAHVLCCMSKGQDVISKIVFRQLDDNRIKVNIDGSNESYFLVAK